MCKQIKFDDGVSLNEFNKLEINGGVPLIGNVKIASAKNAFLPLIASLLVTEDEIIIPLNNLIDVKTKLQLLECIGYKIQIKDKKIIINPTDKINNKLPYDLVSSIRSSILFLGPLLALTGEVLLSFPGGDNLQRTFNYHIDFLRQMGAIIDVKDGLIYGKLPENGKLRGTSYTFDKPSVGATQHMILTGLLCEEGSITTLYNVAQEPECIYLIEMLKNQFGGKITKSGTKLTIIGNGKRLKTNKSHSIEVIKDRIEALTYLALGLITKGEITIEGKKLLECIGNNDLNLLTSIGGELTINDDFIKIKSPEGDLKPINYFESSEFPGISTDFAPILCGLLGVANGVSRFKEQVQPSRFKYIEEINKFGGLFQIDNMNNNSIIITGNQYFSNQNANCTDIRGGMVLLMAALRSKGKSIISNIFHLYRGYQNFIENINSLGGNVKLIKN